MSWFLVLLILGLGRVEGLSSEQAQHHHRHHHKSLPSAVVVGTVYCDTCFQADFSNPNHLISGASVAVECGSEDPKQSFRQEVKTDDHGEFKVMLPSSVSKHLKRIKNCSVKLLSSPQPYCAVASSATSNSLRLKSSHKGTHIFSAGFFTFKPENQPEICSHKPIRFEKADFPDPSFPPPVQDPSMPSPGALPDLPQLPPLPSLPPLPPLPGLPLNPPQPAGNSLNSATSEKKKVKKDGSFQDKKPVRHPQTFLPPIPLQPPSILPPIPLQPPASVLPPNPLQPPPAPFVPPVPSLPPLPPLPGLNPPLPPPPSLPFLPLPPVPIIPGIPPASKKPSP